MYMYRERCIHKYIYIYILPVLVAPGPLSVTSQRQYTPAARQSQSSSSELRGEKQQVDLSMDI